MHTHTQQARKLLREFIKSKGWRVLEDQDGNIYKNVTIQHLWRSTYRRLGWTIHDADLGQMDCAPVLLEWFKSDPFDRESFYFCRSRREELKAKYNNQDIEHKLRVHASDVSREKIYYSSEVSSPDFYNTNKWRSLRYNALLKYGNRCACCGRNPSDGIVLHVDHIKPKSRWPELAHNIENLQILCDECNMGKGNRDQMNWRKLADRIKREDTNRIKSKAIGILLKLGYQIPNSLELERETL